MWMEPIFDRTQSDIDNKTSKGYLNVSDLNRIENNIAELGTMLGLELATTTWSLLSIPTKSHFQRIIDDVNVIKRAWVCPCEDTPTNPINTFEKVNQIEKILYQVYTNFVQHEQIALKVNEEYVSKNTLI